MRLWDGFSVGSRLGLLSLEMEIWNIINGRERVDNKYLPSLPGQKLGLSKEAVGDKFIVDGCRVFVKPPATPSSGC